MPLRTAADLKKGDVLAGKYRVERVIGVGGMGVVAAALHLELGTLVAIKLLMGEASGTDDAIERFSREARAASRLRGEHAVRVFDVGTHSDGTPYIVMEYLVGEDLDSLLTAKGALEITTAVGFVLQACEAIAEAHSIGIVHRDLKPTNLFLTRRIDGSPLVKVLDFGIAKRVDPEVGKSLTGTLVVGSPPYMSPEQMAGSTVDTRTDVWSLGVCLYELLTGVLPFDGNSVLETCTSVLRDAPKPPSELRESIPSGLSQVVMRCLRKDPAQRFSDVSALGEALEPFALPSDRGATSRMRQVLRTLQVGEKAGSSARPALVEAPSEPAPNVGEPRRRRRGTRAAVAAAALGLAAATVVWMLPRSRVELVGRRPNDVTAQTPAVVTLDSAQPVVALRPTASLERAFPDPEGRGADRPETVQGRRVRSPAMATASRAHTIAGAPTASPSAATREPELLVPLPVPPTPFPAPPVSQPAPSAAPSLPPPPPFVIESALVQIGSPTAVVGTTASSVSRALARVGPRMTTCYREALRRMSAPVEGTGILHVETDEDGVTTDCHLSGPLAVALGACITTAARGLTISNVDTGRARADVPLIFKAR